MNTLGTNHMKPSFWQIAITTTCLTLLILKSDPAESRPVLPRDQSSDTLDEITTLGQQLYHYDTAVRIASDTVLASGLRNLKVKYYLAFLTQNEWHVGFGSLSKDRSSFLLSCEVQLSDSFHVLGLRVFDRAVADSGMYLDLSLSILLADRAHSPFQRPYNYAAFRQSDNAYSVYFYPAQTTADIYPLGGDFKYTIVPKGNLILRCDTLHRSILEFKTAMSDSIVASFHKAVITSVPVETDVLFVLLQNKPITHYVYALDWVYAIKPTGDIVRMSRSLFEGMQK